MDQCYHKSVSRNFHILHAVVKDIYYLLVNFRSLLSQFIYVKCQMKWHTSNVLVVWACYLECRMSLGYAFVTRIYTHISRWITRRKNSFILGRESSSTTFVLKRFAYWMSDAGSWRHKPIASSSANQRACGIVSWLSWLVSPFGAWRATYLLVDGQTVLLIRQHSFLNWNIQVSSIRHSFIHFCICCR